MFKKKELPGLSQNQIDWLRLYRSKNVGSRTFWQLINMFGSAANALDRLPELANKGGSKKYQIAKVQDIENEFIQAKKFDAQIIMACDDRFPQQLLNIPDCPAALTIKGNIDLLHTPQIAIVGSRNASLNGCNFANNIAKNLGQENYIITSGLAKGIDSAAHKGSLNTGTIAVIAGGIDHIYPLENKSLYNSIYEKGAVVSELPFGSKPIARNFPQRNRIISGLSQGVLVVEAARKSGTLITANFALEQGREVFAVPGSPLDPRCQGTNHLLKQGAILVESANDIINNLQSPAIKQHDLFSDNENDFINTSTSNIEENILAQYRKTLLSHLSYSPTSIENILKHTDIPFEVLNWLTIELELAGKIERIYGNKIALLAEI